MPALHNYVTIDTVAFLTGGATPREYPTMMFNMCKQMLLESDPGTCSESRFISQNFKLFCYTWKRGCVIGNTKIDKRGDSPVFEIDTQDRWNFQQMLDLEFSETSQNLSSFRELLFSSFHKGDQRKKIKKTAETSQSYTLIFWVLGGWRCR